MGNWGGVGAEFHFPHNLLPTVAAQGMYLIKAERSRIQKSDIRDEGRPYGNPDCLAHGAIPQRVWGEVFDLSCLSLL